MSDKPTKAHPFELAGLGQAPFRYVGAVDTAAGGPLRRIGSVGGYDLHTTPGGTCAYCGHAIIILCNIVSADKKQFHVGSDCVSKTGDKNLVNLVKQEVNRRRREKTSKRNETRIKAAREAVPTVRSQLEALPHPLAWRAEKGDTTADWVDWMFDNAGQSGRLKVARLIEQLQKEKDEKSA